MGLILLRRATLQATQWTFKTTFSTNDEFSAISIDSLDCPFSFFSVQGDC